MIRVVWFVVGAIYYSAAIGSAVTCALKKRWRTRRVCLAIGGICVLICMSRWVPGMRQLVWDPITVFPLEVAALVRAQ